MPNEAKGEFTAARLKSTVNCADIVPERLVEAMLSVTSKSLDALENTMRELARRLEPVTGEVGLPDSYEEPYQQMVPIASRIKVINSRIAQLSIFAEMHLNALEI